MHFVINGKFLRAHQTGVHRVAAELCNALAVLMREGHPAVTGMSFELLVPHDGAERAADIALPRRVIGGPSGNLWEQIVLPLRKGPGTLLSFCNIGPVLCRDAVTMVHDVQVHLSPESYRPAFRLWYRAVQPLFARRHRHLLTVSASAAADMARIGLCPERGVSVIHNGVDHILRVGAEPGATERLGLAENCYVIGLATTQAHKNIGVLLRAFARPEMADITLVLFGGDGKEQFRAAGHDVPANVHFAGRVTDGALRALMESALCLAFPSTTEGFGLPPLEAMLLGCPAILAPCGALPEVCDDAAVYATADDPAAWAEAISAFRDAPVLRAEMAEKGRNRAALFTWRSAALALAEILRSRKVNLS